jgi:hypothetical protein
MNFYPHVIPAKAGIHGISRVRILRTHMDPVRVNASHTNGMTDLLAGDRS